MKALAELLRDADPLSYEQPRRAQERRVRRQHVLDSRCLVEGLPRRSVVVAAVIAFTVVGLAAGAAYWLRLGVDVVAAVRFEVHLAEETPGDGLREAVIPGAGRSVYLHPETVVTNSDIAQAAVVPGDTAATFSVALTFMADGAASMSRATQGHIGRPLAILVDGQVVTAPTVRGVITTSAVIGGSYTRAEAERIVAGIVGR
jgi:preprotein translocase subunit SecD